MMMRMKKIINISLIVSSVLIACGYYFLFTEGKRSILAIVLISIGLVSLCISLTSKIKDKKIDNDNRFKNKRLSVFFIKLLRVSPPVMLPLFTPLILLRYMPPGHYSINGLFLITGVSGIIGYVIGDFSSNRLKKHMLK